MQNVKNLSLYPISLLSSFVFHLILLARFDDFLSFFLLFFYMNFFCFLTDLSQYQYKVEQEVNNRNYGILQEICSDFNPYEGESFETKFLNFYYYF